MLKCVCGGGALTSLLPSGGTAVLMMLTSLSMNWVMSSCAAWASSSCKCKSSSTSCVSGNQPSHVHEDYSSAATEIASSSTKETDVKKHPWTFECDGERTRLLQLNYLLLPWSDWSWTQDLEDRWDLLTQTIAIQLHCGRRELWVDPECLLWQWGDYVASSSSTALYHAI